MCERFKKSKNNKNKKLNIWCEINPQKSIFSHVINVNNLKIKKKKFASFIPAECERDLQEYVRGKCLQLAGNSRKNAKLICKLNGK